MHTVSIHLSGEIHTNESQSEFKGFSNSLDVWMSKKKNPQVLGIGQVVCCCCFFFHLLIIFHTHTPKTKHTWQITKQNAHAQLFPAIEKAPLQTCAGTNTSVNLQSVDPLSAETV